MGTRKTKPKFSGWVEFSFQALVVLASFFLPALWFSYHYESSLLSVVLTVTLSSVRVAASHEVQIRDHNGQTGPEPLHNFTGCKIGHSLPEGARSVAVASPGRACSLLRDHGLSPSSMVMVESSLLYLPR